VKEGFISNSQHTRLYYSFILNLKEKLEREGGAKAISFNDLIHVIWSLIATEEENLMNPIIPILYERLYEFKRPGKAITREELLELYQINLYAQD
jgi:hypothetical protein